MGPDFIADSAQTKNPLPDRSHPHGSRTNLVLALLFVLLLPVYPLLNHAREPLHNLTTSFDRRIPFCPEFVVVYLSYFPFVVGTALFFSFSKLKLVFARLCLAGSLTLVVSYLCYGFFQTFVQRPTPVGSGFVATLVRWLYTRDEPYNAFPSLHVGLSVLCVLALREAKQFRTLSALWAAAIVASTLLVKQHVLADVASGAVLALVSYLLAGKIGRQSIPGDQ